MKMKIVPFALALLLIMSASVMAAPTVRLSPNPVSPQPLGQQVVTTASAQGVGSLTYRWWIYDGITWTMVQDWTPASSFAWVAPRVGSEWRIGVWVQDDTGEQTYESIPYVITATPTTVTLPPVPQCGPLALSGSGSIPSDPPGPTWIELSNTSPYAQGPYTAGSQSLPYTIPPGWIFYLTDIAFQTKAIPGAWPSYAVLPGLFTVSTDAPRLHLHTPLALPSGFTLTASVHNNTGSNPVNMIVLISGVLAETWSRYQTCR